MQNVQRHEVFGKPNPLILVQMELIADDQFVLATWRVGLSEVKLPVNHQQAAGLVLGQAYVFYFGRADLIRPDAATTP